MHGQFIEKALEISRKRKRVLEKMREAVRAGDQDRVFSMARKLVGVTHEDGKRNRIGPHVN